MIIDEATRLGVGKLNAAGCTARWVISRIGTHPQMQQMMSEGRRKSSWSNMHAANHLDSPG